MNIPNNKQVDAAASAAVARAAAELTKIKAGEDLQTQDDALEVAKFVAMINSHKNQGMKEVVEPGTGLNRLQIGFDGKPIRMQGDVDPNALYKHLLQVAEHNKKVYGSQSIKPVVQQTPVQQTSIPPLLAEVESSKQLTLDFDSAEQKQVPSISVQSTNKEQETLKQEQELIKEKIVQIEGKLNKIDNIEALLQALVGKNNDKA